MIVSADERNDPWLDHCTARCPQAEKTMSLRKQELNYAEQTHTQTHTTVDSCVSA